MRRIERLSVQLIMAFLIVLNFGIAFGQGALDRPHPRVSELQDKMTEYARSYLQTRLPDIPFLITIRIDPLRRISGNNYEGPAEKLPYFDLSDEEIRDEWDDPKASIYTLQSRIQKATVVVTLPQSLKDAEADEIKDNLMALLRLIPGRDEIRVDRRSWSLGANFWNYVSLSGVLVLLLLFGLMFVSRSWAGKLANAIHDIKPKEKDSSEAPAPINLGGMGGGTGAGGSGGGIGSAGDVKFRDPLRTREFVNARIQELMEAKHFPNLEAMIEMDKLAQRSPRELGALLMEFPKTKQEEIFSLSSHPSWLDAFSNPGELGSETLELLDRISRIHGEGHDPEMDKLLIQVWRLGEDRVKFLKSMSKEEAFSVLKLMPTSISVPAARLAFPGNWAALLDPTYEPKKLPEGRKKEIMWYSIEEKPLLDFKALEKYRQERDLLEYLQIAGVNEERDIYEALPVESFLWQVRPPFYKVMMAEKSILAHVFERATLDDWALALFNVQRDMRQPIEEFFNSKQKFLFLNKMRTIDTSQVEKRILGLAREKIGRIYAEVSRNAKYAQQSVDDTMSDTITGGKSDEAKSDDAA